MYLSNSALDKYELCPRLFKYYYKDKIKSNQTTTALLFGSAIDEACDILLKDKDIERSISKFKELFVPLPSNVHIYNKDYDWNSLNDDDVNLLNSMDDSRDKELEYAYRSLLGKGVIFLNKLHDDFINDLDRVIDSQVQVKIDNGDHTIIGYIDFILRMKDGSILLVDLKTSSKSYSDRMLNESQQLHLYDFCLKLMKKRGVYDNDMPEKIAYLVLRKDFNTKGEMRNIQFKVTRPNEDFSLQVIERFDSLIEKIDNDEYPKTEKRFNCTKQFGKKCEYYDLCYTDKTVDDIEHLYIKEKN